MKSTGERYTLNIEIMETFLFIMFFELIFFFVVYFLFYFIGRPAKRVGKADTSKKEPIID